MSEQIEQRVTRLESEVQQIQTTLSKIDDRTSKQEREQVRTQTMVEGIQRDMTQMNINVAKLTDAHQQTSQKIADTHTAMLQAITNLNTNQTGKWEKFWQNIAIGIISAIVSIGGVLLAKLLHF